MIHSDKAAFMGMMFNVLQNIQRFFVALCVVLGVQNSVFADELAYSIEPIPSWVEPVPAFSSALSVSAEPDHGYRDQLSDRQINAIERGNTRVFRAVEYALTNAFGVENFSDIQVSFNPGYQTLRLHELIILRDGVSINKLATVNFNVTRNELDSTRHAYNPTQTVATVLDDLRVGDTIRFSYTLAGDNPMFAGNREFYVNTELWTQLDRQYFRILSPSDEPLNRRIRGADVSLLVKDTLGVQEVVLDQRGVAEYNTENGVPSWRASQGVIVFSDMDNWQDVVAWAQPLFSLPAVASEEVAQVAHSIKQLHVRRDQQIGAALRWVQEQIAHIDVDYSDSVQRPVKPGTTLTRGYADSKGKALLLIAILRQLNIDAYAALVNKQRGLEAGDYPFRLRAFNHVVVQLDYDGSSHFLDPGRRSQGGALGEIYEPNYGRALTLKPDTVGLAPMTDSRSIVQKYVTKELTLPVDEADSATPTVQGNADPSVRAARLKVTSRKRGLLADKLRQSLKTGGPSNLTQAYLEYYQVLFPSITVVDSIAHSDSAGNNSTFVEHYAIAEFWNHADKVGEHRWLYADEIIGYLDLPAKTASRQLPYELTHPVNIEETWVLPISNKVRMHVEEASVENEWVSFSKKLAIDEEKNQATITFNYVTLANEVAARDLQLYVAAVEEITDQASFYLEHRPVLAAAQKPVSIPWNTSKIKFWVSFIAMVYLAAWSLRYMKKYRKASEYYSDF